MRPIDADSLEKVFINRLDEGLFFYSEVMEIIDNAPTVEPETKVVANVTFNKEEMEELVEKAKADVLAQIERPQGYWNYIQAGMAVCPFCGASSHKDYKNFCPNCGAKMQKGGQVMKDQFYLHFDTMPKATAQQKGVSIVHGKPHFYEKKNVASARQEFTLALKEYRPKMPSERPIRLKICFCFDVKDKKKWGQPKPTKPDTDNYLKLLKDCMTDVGFWKDDSQVVDEHVWKYYSEKASIMVYWEEVTDVS